MTAITPEPMVTDLSLVPAASSPIAFPAPAENADFNLTPPAPIEAGGNSPPLVVHPGTVIPGEPRTTTASGNTYVFTARISPFIPMPIAGAKNIFNQSPYPPFGASGFPFNPTPPPTLP